MFVIKNETLPKMLEEMDILLNAIEVKGDSVQSLYRSRLILKDLYSSIVKEESPKGDLKQKEE